MITVAPLVDALNAVEELDDNWMSEVSDLLDVLPIPEWDDDAEEKLVKMVIEKAPLSHRGELYKRYLEAATRAQKDAAARICTHALLESPTEQLPEIAYNVLAGISQDGSEYLVKFCTEIIAFEVSEELREVSDELKVETYVQALKALVECDRQIEAYQFVSEIKDAEFAQQVKDESAKIGIVLSLKKIQDEVDENRYVDRQKKEIQKDHGHLGRVTKQTITQQAQKGQWSLVKKLLLAVAEKSGANLEESAVEFIVDQLGELTKHDLVGTQKVLNETLKHRAKMHQTPFPKLKELMEDTMEHLAQTGRTKKFTELGETIQVYTPNPNRTLNKATDQLIEKLVQVQSRIDRVAGLIQDSQPADVAEI